METKSNKELHQSEAENASYQHSPVNVNPNCSRKGEIQTRFQALSDMGKVATLRNLSKSVSVSKKVDPLWF